MKTPRACSDSLMDTRWVIGKVVVSVDMIIPPCVTVVNSRCRLHYPTLFSSHGKGWIVTEKADDTRASSFLDKLDDVAVGVLNEHAFAESPLMVGGCYHAGRDKRKPSLHDIPCSDIRIRCDDPRL